MTKRLQIPGEPRFVRVFALTVDPGDTLGLLMKSRRHSYEMGVLGNLRRSTSRSRRKRQPATASSRTSQRR